jgi:hypothetical protein
VSVVSYRRNIIRLSFEIGVLELSMIFERSKEARQICFLESVCLCHCTQANWKCREIWGGGGVAEGEKKTG